MAHAVLAVASVASVLEALFVVSIVMSATIVCSLRQLFTELGHSLGCVTEAHRT